MLSMGIGYSRDTAYLWAVRAKKYHSSDSNDSQLQPNNSSIRPRIALWPDEQEYDTQV
jgi:hypothetical protein